MPHTYRIEYLNIPYYTDLWQSGELQQHAVDVYRDEIRIARFTEAKAIGGKEEGNDYITYAKKFLELVKMMDSISV